MVRSGIFQFEGNAHTMTVEAAQDRLARPEIASAPVKVRMKPELRRAISNAADRLHMTISAWLRLSALTTLTSESRSAGELYDRIDGLQRWARIDGDQIKGIGYHDAKPDDGNVYLPVVHVDSEPFDIAQHWRLAPVYTLEADRVVCTYPIVAKSWEHA